MNDQAKLNMIIGKINQMEAMIMALIRVIDHDHVIDLDQINIKSSAHDHDQDQDQDQDLIEWYKEFLTDNGVDPENRDYGPAIRSIRYFRQRFATISNPSKYGMTFLPKQKQKPPADPAESSDFVLGIPIQDVKAKVEYLDQHTFNQVVAKKPSILTIAKTLDKALDNEYKRNVVTAYAIQLGLL